MSEKIKYKWLWAFLGFILIPINYFVYVVDRALMGFFIKHYESYLQWDRNEIIKKIYPKKEHGLIVEIRQKPVSYIRALTLTFILWLILF